MPIVLVVVSALIGLFTLTSFATFKEIKNRKVKKTPKFLEQWKKIKDKIDR